LCRFCFLNILDINYIGFIQCHENKRLLSWSKEISLFPSIKIKSVGS
jgi:hypothetical protein